MNRMIFPGSLRGRSNLYEESLHEMINLSVNPPKAK